MIPKPELMRWNQFQAWRKDAGGGPEGIRGKKEQGRESGLWRAVMREYYGADWWERAYRRKADATEEKISLGLEVRKLYPEVPATSVGSGPPTAPQSSSMLRRLNELLMDADSYEDLQPRHTRV